MSQVQQAENLLKKLREDITLEQERLAVARNQRENLEKRNKIVLEAIEKAGDNKQRLIIEQAQAYQKSIDEQVAKSEEVKVHLLDDINRLNKRKSSLEKTVDELFEAKKNMDRQLEDDSLKHQSGVDQIVAQLTQIKDNEEKINNSRTQLRELERTKHDIESDIDILRKEADTKHGEIIELDDQYKSQKEILDNDLYETQLKLEKAKVSLIEAQRKDKAFRDAWAEEKMKLDNRTATVRRMEAKVSDAESRIEELKKYDLL